MKKRIISFMNKMLSAKIATFNALAVLATVLLCIGKIDQNIWSWFVGSLYAAAYGLRQLTKLKYGTDDPIEREYYGD